MKTIAFGDHSKPGFSLYLVKLAARSRGREVAAKAKKNPVLRNHFNPATRPRTDWYRGRRHCSCWKKTRVFCHRLRTQETR